MSSSIKSAGRLEFSTVWEKAEEGTEAFGCFGLCLTANNDVLAFCEGRIGWRDFDPQHLFCKRSTDGGRTWSANRVVRESRNGEVFHNPTPVIDRESGAVFLFFADCRGNFESKIQFLRSDDDGVSWTGPFDVTAKFRNDEKKRAFHLPGPGHGIQLRSGRLIVPVWHRHPIDEDFLPHISERDYGNSILFSDDNGLTWTNGGFTDSGVESALVGQTSESRCLEIDDGSLLMNARMGIPHRQATGPNRMIRISRDGGLSWEEKRFTVFDASFPTDSPSIAYDGNRQIYARPDCAGRVSGDHSENGRRNMTAYLCRDSMREVISSRVVDPGPSYYSDLCLVPDQLMLLLYGTGDFNSWMGNEVRCARFDLDWLQGS